MTLRLYMDKDSETGAVVQALRRAGVDVLTTSEAGRDLVSDSEQLEFASGEGRALYTANVRDFAPLHADWLRTGSSHAGIIVRYRQQTPVGQQIRGLVLIHAALDDGATDRLEVLEDWLRPAR